MSLRTSSRIALSALEKKRFLDCITRFRKSRVLVVGDFILDQFIWGTVDRISPEAPVPVVLVNRESYMPGGALNVANNIHSLGGKVYPCGVLGRDLQGRMLVKVMRSNGIETGGVLSDASRPTSLKTRIIAHSQQVVRFDRENNSEIPAEKTRKIVQFVRERIQEADVLVIEDYGKGLIQPEMLKALVRIARKHKKPVLVDPKEKHFPFYKGVTLITPNRKEAYGGYLNGAAGAAKPAIEEVGRGLLKKLQCDAVLITLGEDGMALFEKSGKITKIPTAAREVYDVSGAGDTVIAVLALALAAGARMPDASILANLAAGIVVGKLGTANVTPDELRQAVEAAGRKN